MSRRRVRVVVIVRCPLCGCWIPSDGQVTHSRAHHPGATIPGRYSPLEDADGTPVDADEALRLELPELPRAVELDQAHELLRELGWCRRQGQKAGLGFEIYER